MVEKLADYPAEHKWVVASQLGHGCSVGWSLAGFETIVNRCAREGIGTSVAVAASRAISVRSDALLICLADMPLVPLGHLVALIDAGRMTGHNGIASSFDGRSRSPPAFFAKHHLHYLASLSGDNGARELIAGGAIVECSEEALVDIDTPETLSQLGSVGSRYC